MRGVTNKRSRDEDGHYSPPRKKTVLNAPCNSPSSSDSEDDGDDNSCSGENDQFESSLEQKWLLENVFPAGYDYIGLNLKQFSTTNNYDLEVHINLSQDNIKMWIQAFEKTSGTDLRSRKTFPHMSKKRFTYKAEYRCHHNTLPSSRTKKPHYKHVSCPFLLRISLKNTNMERSSDKYLTSHPCVVTMLNVLHNHPIRASDALRHRRPSEEVVLKFTNLFKQGHSPSSALNTHKFDLQSEYGSSYITAAGDGSLCPSVKWCFYWYKKMFSEMYGAQDGTEMIDSLKTFVSDYNTECGSECAKLKTTPGGDYMVAICTPLMKKVHKLIQGSGEMVFVDSGGGMDRHLSRVFMIMTPSVAGALPLGVVITSSESEVILKEAFQLYISLLPEDAFYGRGLQGPRIFMTDDCAAERNTLRSLFPDALLLLCIFHVLQAVWRWLLDSNHKIAKVDKPVLYDLFKDILNAKTVEDLYQKYEAFKSHPVTQTYPKAEEHVTKMMVRVAEWALCFRLSVLTRGHNTNNYCEATMKILKDFIFFRCKAYSLVQLFHFLTTRLDRYFERRIIAVINNRVENYVKSRYHIKEEKLVPLSCVKESEHVYLVSNSKSKQCYTVNMDVEICTCPVGKTGAPCKHQFYVVKEHNLSSQQFLPFTDEKAKKLLYKLISSPNEELPPEWFSSLRSDHVDPFAMGASKLPLDSDILPLTMNTCENSSVDTREDAQGDVCVEAGPVSEIVEDSAGGAREEADLSSEIAERITKCNARINMFMNYLQEKLAQRHDLFLPALEKMMDRFETECKTDNASVSAIYSFNRYNNPNAVRQGNTMPPNHHAISRRMAALGGARNIHITGRPPNSVRIVPEHGYIKAATPSEKFSAPRPTSKLPHCISQRIVAYTQSSKQ